MAENSTATAFSGDSTELDSFVVKNPSTAAIQGDSDVQDVDIENSRGCNRQRLIVGIIVLLGIICLVIGIVLISFAKDKHEDGKCVRKGSQNGTEKLMADVCSSSEEAARVSLYKMLQKIQDEVFALNPHILIFKPQTTNEEIRQHFKPYDPAPSEIKRRTDEAWRLLAEVNATKVDVTKLKLRERKALSQVKFYLRHVFGQPYDGNYYAGDWMLGPNFFCWQPICSIGREMSDHLAAFAPRNLSDMEVIHSVLKAYNKSITRYMKNVKLGVKTGMVGSIEECRGGLDSFKEIFSHIASSKEGMLNLTSTLIITKEKPSIYFILQNSKYHVQFSSSLVVPNVIGSWKIKCTMSFTQ